MNKFILYIVASVLTGSIVMSCGSTSGATQVAKAKESMAEMKARKLKEEYEEKMDYFEKNNYRVTSTSRSLAVSLLNHYEKLESDKYEEISVTTEGCPTISLCAKKSLADAQSNYATLANSFIKGKVTSEGGYNAAGTDEEEKAALDRFYGAYAQYVSADISGRLKKGLAVVKKTDNGYKYEAFYLVEKEAARLARLAALRKAQKETEENIKWGQTIEDWVNDVPQQN